MKKILFLLLFILGLTQAKESYQTYNYHDKHNVKMTLQGSVSKRVVEINATLHVREIEDSNKTTYTLFWLERGLKEKNQIDKNSIYAPFLIKNKRDTGFRIEKLLSLNNDKEINDKLMGLVDTLQFNNKKSGLYYFKNAEGKMETNETKIDNSYKMQYLKQYTKNNPREDIEYSNSFGEMTIDNNSSLWEYVLLKQNIDMHVKAINSTIVDKREFLLKKSKKILNKSHWFFKLTTDISKWGFLTKKVKKTSYKQALNDFDKKMKELKKLLEENKDIEKWVKSNMDTLEYLDEILETKTLDDQVSQNLFAKLGYIDSSQTTNILSKVSLNEDIPEKERFRGVMGLKNTSAPIDDELLEKVISYGLSSEKSNDMQQSIGMIAGALAKNRVDRVPEQYERISDEIVNTINSSNNKMVALNAAGNMLTTAPKRVVESIDNVLMLSSDSYTREKSAEALTRIKKSSLTLSNIEKLIESENHSDTSTALIYATAITSDNATTKKERTQLLIKIAKGESSMKSNRIAALKVLKKSNFGKNQNEKNEVRNMMLKEVDSDVQTLLREIYRK